MKLHKKYPHHFKGAVYYGQRNEIPLRINYAKNYTKENIKDPLHFHEKGTQFFLVIKGKLTVEINKKKIKLTSDKLLEIQPKEIYRVIQASEDCEWIVIGTKNIKGDRKEII